MALFRWKKFNFLELVKDVDEGSLETALQGKNVVCCTSGRGHLVLGDDDGVIHFLNRNLRATSIRAFNKRVRLLHQLKQSGTLITLGDDDDDVGSVLKVYNLDQPDKNGNPSLVRASFINSPGSGGSVPTCMAGHENKNLLAIGFKSGALMLLRGDVLKDRGTKQQILVEPGNPEISGLVFKTLSTQLSTLYVATVGSVFKFTIGPKEVEAEAHLDNVGCPTGAVASVDNMPDTQFVVGNKEAIYCYNTDGRGQCYAFMGQKEGLMWHRSYLIVATLENPTPGSEKVDSSTTGLEKNTLTVFDVQNKFIAFTAPVKPIQALISEWGLLFAITTENKIIQLTEKDTEAKLDILFKKNFYDIALQIAKHQQYDEDGLVDIFRKYGDHLYAKGNYVDAIANYTKTIGHLGAVPLRDMKLSSRSIETWTIEIRS